MPYGRCKLIDPAPGGLGTYDWQVNYSEEGEFGRSRNLDVTTTTDGTKIIVQQGEDEPMNISVQGTILHANQHNKFVDYFKKSKLQSLIFQDFEGHQYEVMMTAYKPQRQRTIRNPRDSTIRLHYYTYTLEMFVLRVISGPWVGA